ncbi:trypsin-like serine peptidase [Roseomonas elaeocarpi]|uniref:Trypsin-like serine peptidase n=1 Tax=Roseomonas elaeocarpi TaxID=907779 RepID=A0ABV6JW81_9PROT
MPRRGGVGAAPARIALLAGLAMMLPFWVGSAAAREAAPVIPPSQLPGVEAHDARHVVDGEAAPWTALGRVQTELGTRCTGTMIAPRVVLTAAHCLVAPRSGQLVQPGSVHFLLGYHAGNWVAQARATGFRVGPGFEAARRGPPGADWAILTLDAAIGVPGRVLPLLRAVPPPGTPLSLGGYQQDRAEVLIADTTCRALGLQLVEGVPMLVHGCAGTRGSSGAPVLARQPGGDWAVAGVAVAASLNRAMGIAVPAASLRPD